MLSERYVPEVWGYFEALPDGTSRAIEHWECILGRAKASDIVLTGEGIDCARHHAAIQRSGGAGRSGRSPRSTAAGASG